MKKNKFLLPIIISTCLMLVPKLSFGAQTTMFADLQEALEFADEDSRQEIAREYIAAALRVLKNMYGKRGVKLVAFIKSDKSGVANEIRSNQEGIIKEVSK
jgi:hypothetical protein